MFSVSQQHSSHPVPDSHKFFPPKQILLQLVFSLFSIILFSGFLVTLYTTVRADHRFKDLDPCKRSTVHAVSFSQSQQSDIPDLFIYRRTKKTGSSTMLDALLRELKPYGYVPVLAGGIEADAIVRAESIHSHPRRLLIAKHNQVMKSTDPYRRAVIADTFRDGYEQMTSYCRYSKGIKECGAEVIDCLKSDHAQAQNRYRWVGKSEESVDTYIDLPLSSAHPALSTTVLRRVFPNATLELDNYNVANSTCPEIPELRKVYNEHYQTLEKQIERLRKRMLILAGYPLEVDSKIDAKISLADMIDAAEESEKLKYNIRESQRTTSSNSKSHSHMLSELRVWTKGDDGSVIVKTKFGQSPK